MTIEDKDFHALLVTAPAKPENLRVLRAFASAFRSSSQGASLDADSAKTLALAIDDLLR